MKKIFWTYIIVGLMSFLGLSSSAAGLSLDFVPSSQTTTLGQQVSVDVEISGRANSGYPSIGVFDLKIDYDSTILDASYVLYGSYLGDTLTEAITATSFFSGEVEISEVSFLTNQTDPSLATLQLGLDSFTLATITFNTLNIGMSPLTFAFETGLGVGDDQGNQFDVLRNSGSITVNSPGPGPGAAVPEPGTILLFGVGLANVIVVARNKLRKN